jgi:hypothetical protein
VIFIPFLMDCSRRAGCDRRRFPAVDRKTLSASAYSHAEPKLVMNSDVSRNQGKSVLTGNSPPASVFIKGVFLECPLLNPSDGSKGTVIKSPVSACADLRQQSG